MLRHEFLAATGAVLIHPQGSAHDDTEIAAIENTVGGRLGVYAIDTGSGKTITHRADERFAMCSTFKLLLVGAVLARVDAGSERLDRRVAIREADLLEYAPVTKAHLKTGSMTVMELCAAAIEWSDNSAANLLIHSLGGPAGVTRYARSLGDPMTRLDREEPALNEALTADRQDTTTPMWMASDTNKLVLGTALKPASRAKLTTWLQGSKTGATRLHPGFPPSWREGDKTGTGENNTVNDVAILWPPKRKPIIVAAYFTASVALDTLRDKVLARVAETVTARFA